MRAILFIFSLVLLLGCNQWHNIPYNVVIATNTGFQIVTDKSFPNSHFNNSKEIGRWTFKVDTLVYSSGNWRDGLKEGLWRYDLGFKKLQLQYSIFDDSTTGFKMSYPDFWIKPSDQIKDAVFLMGDTTISPVHENKLFVVLAHDRQANDIDVNTYNQYYNNKMRSLSCLNYQSWIIQSNLRKYYLNRLLIREKGEDLLVLNLNIESDTVIYDLTYKTTNMDAKEGFLTFFEIAQTARHGNLRLFNPFDIIKSVTKIDEKLNGSNELDLPLESNKIFLSYLYKRNSEVINNFRIINNTPPSSQPSPPSTSYFY